MYLPPDTPREVYALISYWQRFEDHAASNIMMLCALVAVLSMGFRSLLALLAGQKSPADRNAEACKL